MREKKEKGKNEIHRSKKKKRGGGDGRDRKKSWGDL